MIPKTPVTGLDPESEPIVGRNQSAKQNEAEMKV
jgi:hypothetical protein